MRAAVDQMRREQREQPQRRAVEHFEPDALQHDVGARVGEDVLDDAEPAADVGVDELEGGDAVFQPVDARRCSRAFPRRRSRRRR